MWFRDVLPLNLIEFIYFLYFFSIFFLHLRLEVSDLDWDYHITYLPKFKTEQEKQAFIDEKVNEELDMNKPLWRCYVVELGYAKKGEPKGN